MGWGATARLLAFSACLSAACAEGEPAGPATPSERTPAHALGKVAARRHVIVVIGDGMQLAHEVATSRYLFGEDQALSFHGLPVSAFVTTWDVNGYNARADLLGKPPYARDAFEPEVGYDPVIGGEAPYPLLPDSDARREYFLGGPYPDSASTGTAMSTGNKTDYNNIAWASGDPPGGELESSPTYLRNRYGMSVGFVTTGPISHATPADWFAHNVDRFDYLPIGQRNPDDHVA